MHTAAPTSRLGLAPHVRARHCEGQVILLDLRSSRYIGIGPTASAALSLCVKDWPVSLAYSTAPPEVADQFNVQALVQRLISQGLLSHETAEQMSQHSLVAADASLDFEDLTTDIELGARRVSRLLLGAAFSAIRLRAQPLEAIARSVSKRRHKCEGTCATTSSAALSSMRASAIAYERLRPLLFTSYRKCLFDSLTLLEYLAGEGLFPYWVIGVKTNPFGAHSWVQYGSLVLNDQHAHVRQFQPILVA